MLESLGVFFLLVLWDHLAFADLTFFLLDRRDCSYWKVTITSTICHLLFGKNSDGKKIANNFIDQVKNFKM